MHESSQQTGDGSGNPLSPKALLPSFAVVVLLFGTGLLVTRVFHEDILTLLTGHEILGVLVFVGSTALAVILPFWSNLPLVPVATLLYGPLATSALLILGWTLGSAIAFSFARAYQRFMLRRFPSLNRYAFIDMLIHPRYPFLSLVVLRMTFPVDIISYALGIFTLRVSARANFFSTIAGITPFSFLFGYFGVLSPKEQSVVFAVTTTAFFIYYFAFLQRVKIR